MKLGRLAFAAAASAAMLAFALAGCGNPSDGTVWIAPPPPPPNGGNGENGENGGGLPGWLADLGFPDDAPLGVIEGDLPGPFTRVGGAGTTVELVPQGLRVAPTETGWGAGVDLDAGEIGLGAGDTLRITVTGGAGTPAGQQLMIQVAAAGAWADQVLGDLVGITAGAASTWELALTQGHMDRINAPDPHMDPGMLRIRLNNPNNGEFTITGISVD